MNNVFIKLSEEIKFDAPQSFKNIKVLKANLVEGNTFELSFSNPEIIPFNDMNQFLVALNTNFKYRTTFTFETMSIVYDIIEVKRYIK